MKSKMLRIRASRYDIKKNEHAPLRAEVEDGGGVIPEDNLLLSILHRIAGELYSEEYSSEAKEISWEEVTNGE